MGFLYDFGDGWVMNILTLDYVEPYYDDSGKRGDKSYKLGFHFNGEKCFTSSFRTEKDRNQCLDEILAFVPTIKIQHDYSAGCIVPNGTLLSADTLPKEDVRADAYSIPAVQSLFNK